MPARPSIEILQFEIKEICQSFKIDTRHIDLVMREEARLISGIVRQFAAVGQKRVSRNVIHENKFECFIPASAIDYFKEVIVKFEPKLKFGWLVPKYKVITKEVTQYVEEHIFNVYPVAKEEALKGNGRLELAQMSPCEWLVAEPCDTVELQVAREILHDGSWNFDFARVAATLAVTDFSNQRWGK